MSKDIINRMTQPEYGTITNPTAIVDSAIVIMQEASVSEDVIFQIVAKIIAVLEDDQDQAVKVAKV